MIVGVRHRSSNLHAIITNSASPTSPYAYFLLSPARTSNANDAIKSRGLLRVSTFNQSFYPPIPLTLLHPLPFRRLIPPRCPCTPIPTLRIPILHRARWYRALPMSVKYSYLDFDCRNRLTGQYHSGIFIPPAHHLPAHRMQGNGLWSMLRLSGYVYYDTIYLRLQFPPPRSLSPMHISQFCELHGKYSTALYTSPAHSTLAATSSSPPHTCKLSTPLFPCSPDFRNSSDNPRSALSPGRTHLPECHTNIQVPVH